MMYIITCIKKESVYIGALGVAERMVGSAQRVLALLKQGGFTEIATF